MPSRQEFSAVICINSGGSFCSGSRAANLRHPRQPPLICSQSGGTAAAPHCADAELCTLSTSFRVLSKYLTFQGFSKFSTHAVLVDCFPVGRFPGLTRSELARLRGFFFFFFPPHSRNIHRVLLSLRPLLNASTTRIQLSLQLLRPINHEKTHPLILHQCILGQFCSRRFFIRCGERRPIIVFCAVRKRLTVELNKIPDFTESSKLQLWLF